MRLELMRERMPLSRNFLLHLKKPAALISQLHQKIDWVTYQGSEGNAIRIWELFSKAWFFIRSINYNLTTLIS